MSVDDRLRTALKPDREYGTEPPERLIDELIARVERRRRMRVIGIAAAAAVACVVLSLAAPQVFSSINSVDPAVNPSPTTTHPSQVNTRQLPDRTTPIDGQTWMGQVLSRKERLSALQGSKLQARGLTVFRNAGMRDQGSGLVLWQRHFTASAAGHILGSTSDPVEGEFHVEGHQLVIKHVDTPGRTVMRWHKPDADQLVLQFVSTTAPPLYGAPAEAFFKMWSATPFILRLGY